MKLELLSASNFLVHLVRLARRNVSEFQLSRLNEALVEVLRRRYLDHWFPHKPFKGSGFRCIRINGKMDPLVAQAATAAGMSPDFLHKIFPSELTLWVDPAEVSYRIGENGSICVLYEGGEGVTEPWRPTPPSSSSNSNANSSSAKNNKNTSSSQQQQQHQQKAAVITSPTCKDSLRTANYIMESRKSVSIEQLAAYVSS